MVFLTGTPVQNSVRELFSLLSFLDPVVFGRVSDLLTRFGDMRNAECMRALSEFIRPYILQRIKEDVLQALPGKVETLIEVELAPFQRQVYNAMREQAVDELRRLQGGQDKAGGTIMQLRLICNHPFSQVGAEAAFQASPGAPVGEMARLVAASGKLLLLDKLLPLLKAQGRRILIFSQFRKTLDVLDDYLRLRLLPFVRIDGETDQSAREAALAAFRAGGIFVFLITTRSGGVGLNLTEADTAIIFDSDFNAQSDRVCVPRSCVFDVTLDLVHLTFFVLSSS